MVIILFLLFFPLVVAILLGMIERNSLRNWMIRISVAALSIGAVALTIDYFRVHTPYYLVDIELVDLSLFAIEIVVGLYMIYIGIRKKELVVVGLALVQTMLISWFELVGSKGKENLTHHLFIDKLSIIMILIIAIIGGLVCIFAIPYMEEYTKKHPGIKDRRKMFFSVVFLFFSAMFGIVMSNDLLWIYCFWEITTLSSFWLIGYTKTEEAVKNSFTALKMNLIGGVCFAAAIVYVGTLFGVTELKDLIILSTTNISLVIPATLLAIAALSKSAQLPFSRWLLGAMVAPTPSSALLHSSTMVKAGVYLLIRISPLMKGNMAGFLVIFIGGITFFLMSCIAISEEDGKRILAYSTMANLGLIVACCGIGGYEAIWAAVMLIIFHAVAKSLLFLTVGEVEHTLGSRDMETMYGLMIKRPKLAVLLAIGIAGMFLAPFGMLISKWAALKAFIDSKNILLIMFLAYGSAVTLFYWTKWLGNIVALVPATEDKTVEVAKEAWFVLVVQATLTVVLCVLFPLMSDYFVLPFLHDMFYIDHITIIPRGNQPIMAIMLGLIVLVPIGMKLSSKQTGKIIPTYMAGINKGDNKTFEGAMGESKKVYLSAWYMSPYFGEKRLLPVGIIISTIAIITLLAIAIGGNL